ncbi:UvrD-helicase domain-containing protein [Oscillibacter valericigenes]|nr:UvrD-helicase domain-containing protein [Oscillibacter valericigenes]
MEGYNYILFEVTAIEFFVQQQAYQTYKSDEAQKLIQIVLKNLDVNISGINIFKNSDGLIFIGKNPKPEKQFLLFDLQKCDLLKIEAKHPENILTTFQKIFRSAIKFWKGYPFNASERVVGTKLIVFPYAFNFGGKGNKRIVLERQPKIPKSQKTGIDRPFLAYKYSSEDMQDGASELATTDVLENATNEFVYIFEQISSQNVQTTIKTDTVDYAPAPFVHETTSERSDLHEGVKYMDFNQIALTEHQENVVNNIDLSKPFRIDGPAGTGKTMSMILRAYKLLKMHQEINERFKIAFFAHSKSTQHEIEEIFKRNCPEFLWNEEDTSGQPSNQTIEVITLLEWCKRFVEFTDEQLDDTDASDAKEYQRIRIEEVYAEIYNSYYKTYRTLLSDAFNSVLANPEDKVACNVLVHMLQHEFSVQIKGRSDGKYEKYKDLNPIKYGLPARTEREKEFVFKVFQAYQERLEARDKYDPDDVVIEAIQRLNAPRWRRDRATKGFDYILVDEMHLFNANEKYAFEYLTKELNQAEHTEQEGISAKTRKPICFALDYSQAIGDRGLAYNNDFVEMDIDDKNRATYNTIFRSSKKITDFCASIISTGTEFFKTDFLNPYGDSAKSGFSEEEERLSCIPKLFMYNNDDEMINSIKKHISGWRKESAFKENHEVAVISFINDLLCEDTAKNKIGGREFFILKSRNAEGLSKEVKSNNQYVLSSPDNVNGLEFRCVILVGVDGRVPPQTDTNDISSNYLRYAALNQLYLSASRAKYRLIILGSTPYEKSPCLTYALSAHTLEEAPTSVSNLK